ncbi:GPI ethanolamine phosphate transferase 1-like [Topomyia yanbarensis]|uniref:GPI ethanolamine phosphate transferase 1-like n=1 Tax=Topomyia yanbarensis TaxID=2498891 RepID=UPI00273A8E5B|nr:GPI ethanolamine phosphate transferase 1-like [Topomyia yanbarensis]
MKSENTAYYSRVVVFVADGLRAESLLKHQANRTNFLKDVILSNGAFGISHTRVPTESRPGHVALFAGIYEDPSAVFKGWKENPVEFDSVFNRSNFAFIWGSPDILSVFSNGAVSEKIRTDAYPVDIESFAFSSNTSLLDTWVFQKVKYFLSDPEHRQFILKEEKIILFLHLLGLDTAGHVHKPYSDNFSENLIIVDEGIKEIVNLIDEVTNRDRKTAFIFTSDHGMTDRGSHGSGHFTETETPFIAWGAGIQHWRKSLTNGYFDHIVIDGVNIPSWDLNQADVAPLISTLLGIAIPKNSCGKLPRHYLNASEFYIAHSSWKNAEQLYQQYRQWHHKSNQKWFQWSFSNKETLYSTSIERLRRNIDVTEKNKNYNEMIVLSEQLLDVILEAIDYYQTYYKYELLFAISIAMAGWILITTGKIFLNEGSFGKISVQLCSSVLAAAFVICIYNILQGTPIIVTFYFTLPVLLWIPVLSRWRLYLKMINKRVIWQTIIFLICAELCKLVSQENGTKEKRGLSKMQLGLRQGASTVDAIQTVLKSSEKVASFFQREVISGFLIVQTGLIASRIYKKRKQNGLLFFVVLSNAILAIFPLIPTVEKDSNNPQLLSLGIFLWALVILIACAKSYEGFFYRSAQFIFVMVLIFNMLYCIGIAKNGFKSNWINQIISWTLVATSFLIPLLTTTSLQSRMVAVIVNLAGPFMMLSLSYEPLFLLAFSSSLLAWVRTEDMLWNTKEQWITSFYSRNQTPFRPVGIEDVRRATIFVFYMLISFFGTGNLATVSSFDPNWLRFFISTFSPFVMTGLIVFKLLIPLLILLCVLRAIQIITQVQTQTVFLLIFIICNLTCLHFFYLIKNKGSWLDIGLSISHFIIMECTTIILILLNGCAKLITEASIASDISKPRNKFHYKLPYSSKTNKD